MAWLPAVAAVLVRPWLWPAAVSQVRAMVVTGWWRRWPPVPTPDPAWVAFRMTTQYGSPDASPAPGDLLAFLRWRRAWRAASR